MTASPLPVPDAPRTPAPARRWPLWPVVVLPVLAIQLLVYDRWLVVLDEGYVLQLADEVNRGRVLYRDVYVDAPFPGAFWILAAWFRAFGTSIWASRLLMVTAYTGFAVALVAIARRTVARGWAAGLVLVLVSYRLWAFPHWHMVSYSTMAVTALTVAVALVGRHLRTRAAAPLAAAGALAAVGILCKQDYGFGVAGALGLFLLLRPLLARRAADVAPRPPGALAAALVFSAGAVAVLLPATAWLAWQGALPGLIEQAIVRPLSGATFLGYVQLPRPWPLFGQDQTLREQIGSYFPAILLTLRWNAIAFGALYQQTAVWDVTLKLLFWAPIAVFALAALAWLPAALGRSWRAAATAEDERRLLLLAWAGGFLLAFNRPRDWVHLMMVYPPALVVGTALLAHGVRPAPVYVRRAVGGVATALAGLLALVSLDLAFDLRGRLDWKLDLPRAGVWVDQHHGPVMEDVLAHVAARVPPGTPVPVYPLQPMISFLANRESAGGFHVIWPVQDPARDDKIIADIEAGRLPLVVYSLSQYAHLGSFRQNAPRLFDYLVDHYALERVFSRESFGPLYTTLARRPDTPLPGFPMYDVAPDWPGDGVTRPARWPFAHVMAQRVSRPAAPALARFVVPLPPGAPRLAFAYGVNPERWLDRPLGPLTFTVHVEGDDGTPVATPFTATVDPWRELADRRWADASVDLTPWAGRRITLAFAVTAYEEAADPTDVAGWVAPRIVP